MRKNETDSGREILSRIKSAGIMSLICVAISVVILFVMAILIENEILPSSVASISSAVVIIPVTFIASMLCVKMNNGKTMISGILTAVMTVLILLIGSMFFKGRGEPSIVIISGCVISGIAAGLFGGRKRKTR